MSKRLYLGSVAVAAVAALCICPAFSASEARAAAAPSMAGAVATDAKCSLTSPDSHLILAHAATSTPLYGYNQGVDMRDDTGYNGDYLFAMTKGVASSAITPAVKPLLFLLTVPLDIVTLPFTAIAGFF